MRVVKTKKSTQKANIFTIRKIKNQRKWTKEEDILLIQLAEKFNEKHWKEISKRFVKKNPLQCFSRYKRIRPGIIKGSWKKEEDLKIIDLVTIYGKSWSKISKILGSRNGKQIRDRFINVLDPEIRKGKFTEDEDNKLIALFKQHGPKWATIARYYPKRTADMIKNRFHSSIKKKIGEDLTEKMFKECKEEIVFTLKQNDYNNQTSMNHYANNYGQEVTMKEENSKEMYSGEASKFCDEDFYSNNSQFNYDIFTAEKEDATIDNGAFTWSLEDFMTI